MLAFPLSDVLNVKSKKGQLLGVEIEIEYRTAEARMEAINALQGPWNFHEDGSLRGFGAEFVSSAPKTLPSILEDLKLFYAQHKPENVLEDSTRTSIHVHMNCLGLTQLQLLNAVTRYYLLEPILFTLVSPSRKGNLFCVSSSESVANLTLLSASVAKYDNIGQNDPRRPRQTYGKYASLNLESLFRFGSAESRIMEGRYDEGISHWVRLLHNLWYCHGNLSKEQNPATVFRLAFEDTERFIRESLDMGAVRYFNPALTMDEMVRLVDTAYSNVLILAEASPDGWTGEKDWRKFTGYKEYCESYGASPYRTRQWDVTPYILQNGYDPLTSMGIGYQSHSALDEAWRRSRVAEGDNEDQEDVLNAALEQPRARGFQVEALPLQAPPPQLNLADFDPLLQIFARPAPIRPPPPQSLRRPHGQPVRG
jgi:hypothetical protein